MSGVNNRHGLHFSAIAYQNSIWKLRPAYLRWPITKEEKKGKKSININTPSAVVAKTDPISTSCSQPASTRITPALMHHSACTRVHASGQATSELSRVLSKCRGGWQHIQQMLWQLYWKHRWYFSIFLFKKKKCMKALRQPEEQHRSPCGLLGHVTERLTPAWRVTGGWLSDRCHFSPVSRDNFCSFCCLTSAWPPPMSSSRRTFDECRAPHREWGCGHLFASGSRQRLQKFSVMV